MKNILVLSVALGLFFGSCKTSQLVSYNDDVYSSPAEIKRLARIAEEDNAKALATEKQKRQDELAAQRAKDDANPYYKDPSYNQDDYYDYQYASRLNRFSNPVQGAGFYNPYYTNTYTYNQNPMMYGTSIYSSYNYWMPSNQFNSYNTSIGFSYGNMNSFGGNYGGYNNYCGSNYYGYSSNSSYWNNSMYGSSCGNGYYNGCNNGFYNSYGYNSGYYSGGYYNGYSNYGNNGGWGYYNSYDPNSLYSKVEYAPRTGSFNGDGTRQDIGPRMSQGSPDGRQYLESVAAEQDKSPRFTNTAGQRISSRNSGAASNEPQGRMSDQSRGGVQNNSSNSNNQGYNSNATETYSSPGRTNYGGTPSTSNQTQTNQTQNNDRANSESIFGTRMTQSSTDRTISNDNQAGRSGGGGNTGGNSGGNTGGSSPAPRNSGGGGGNSPR